MPRYETLKKYIEVKVDEKVIAICPIKECEPLEFVKLQEEAKKNRVALIFNYNNKIAQLESKIKQLENDIKYLKGEE